MKKKSNDELGTLITREMKAMMRDETLSKEHRFDIISCIMFDIDTNSSLLNSFAKSLKVGFDKINSDRYQWYDYERKRKSEYARKNRQPLPYIDDDSRLLPSIDGHRQEKAGISTKTKQNKTIDNIPLNPPSGVEGENTDCVSDKETSREALAKRAGEIADALEKTEAFCHMTVNRGKLMKCLVSVLKKNSATGKEEILGGLAKWTSAWAADGWRWVPGKMTDWLYDGKWRQEPRKKDAPAVGAGCGEAGVVDEWDEEAVRARIAAASRK